MYSREGGMDVGLVADLLGYESGDQMIQELANTLPKKDFVEQQTDASNEGSPSGASTKARPSR
jgi:hypothetical protein